MSNFQKLREQQFEEDLEKFIIYFTGFVPSQKNFEIAHKYASSNLKYHTFLDPDAHQIQQKFEDILVKLQVMSKPETADFLSTLFLALKKCPLKKDYNDMHHRILSCLLLLSSNLIEHNQNREPNRNVLKGKQIDQISVSSIDSLKDWKFESSSSEEDEDVEEELEINKQQQEKKQDEKIEPTLVIKEQLPNILWHLGGNKKKSFNEFLNSSGNLKLKSTQLFLAENQNKSQEILNQQRIVNLIATEKDVVIAILYCFQGLKSELLTIQQGQYVLSDFDVRHLSHESLLNSTQPFLEFADIVNFLKRPMSMIPKPSLLNAEILIKEQFWHGVRSILLEFDQLITSLLEQIIYDEKYKLKETENSITLIYLGQKLQPWFTILKQVNLAAQKILQSEGNSGIFDSPTLTILYNVCNQNSLQPQAYQAYIQRLFLYALDPYLRLLDKYLDYDSTIQDSFTNLPVFIQGCSTQLKNIGQAFQIFQKVELPALEQIQFRKLFIKRLCQVTNTLPVKKQFEKLEFCTLKGAYKYHDPFTIQKVQEREVKIIQSEEYNIKNIKNPDLIKIFQKEITKLIKQEDQNIQNILLEYLNNHLQFQKLLKYLRCLFFFERIDLMEQFIEQVADSHSLAKLRTIQNAIQDSLGKLHNFKNYQLLPNLICQQSQLFSVSHKSINFKIQFPHPIDLIINDNTLILYNKIMQFLLFFKNSKLHLQESQISLVKKFKKKLSNYLLFGNELMHFLTNYEYFLFVSIIQVQTEQFIKKVNQSLNFQEIIGHHNTYLKAISDKMFLNQKSESILDAIYKIIDIVQNYPLLVDRIFALEIVDSITRNLETMRVESEFNKMKDSFHQQISALILLFDNHVQRFTQAPEIIECILKVNFNQFYR